jgi:hypothetical protein
MYPIDVPSLVHRSLCGMNGDDPTLLNGPTRRRNVVRLLRALRAGNRECPRPAGVDSESAD